jgi:predicted CXXCH cytochrome family protein
MRPIASHPVQSKRAFSRREARLGRFASGLLAAAALWTAPGAGLAAPKQVEPKPAASKAAATRLVYPLAPVKGKPVSSHSPFDTGDCSLCHVHKSAKDPGPVTLKGNQSCLTCHEDFQDLLDNRRFKHSVAGENCTTCHNPHNASQRKLLNAQPNTLCLACHEETEKQMADKFKHAAVTEGNGCMNCHNPHASNVQHLLTRLPFDLCLQCHNKDGMTDPQGLKLTNMKKLLDANPQHHGPVAQKDCSACHKPHGSDIFRLLTEAYPSTFYAPYETKTYTLCFNCHDEQLVTQEKTSTATRFRDGDRNLHFLHVNKPDRGRTCRACHEVHAAQKVYQIRESVPYGAKNYLLKVSYAKRPDGGDCTQTCHTARGYTNNAAPPAPQPKGK